VDTDLFIESKKINYKCCIYASKNGDRSILMDKLSNNEIFNIYKINYDYDITFDDKKQDVINYINLTNKYLINLNSKSMAAGIQNRVYETMAVNRISLSHKPTNIPGRIDIWKSLDNVIWYDDENDIINLCNDIIINIDKYNYIMENARNEVLNKYTPKHNIDKILQAICITI
jgi:spore maturation protein CgeB